MGYEVDFLPVGNAGQSGDAITLRFGNLFGDRREQTIVVIDGGFKDTGEEIVRHINNYYGQPSYIDLVISSHPDGDHSSGLEIILENFEVKQLWMHRPWKHTVNIANMFQSGRVTDKSVSLALQKSLNTARSLEQIAEAKQIPIIEPFAGLSDDSGSLLVLGPTEAYYESLLPHFNATPKPKASLFEKAIYEAKEFVKRIAERWDYETLDDGGEVSAENNSSTILLLIADGNPLLFTADAGIPALSKVADRLEDINFDFSKITLIQVPHHGSKRNVGPTILDRIIGPKLTTDQHLKSAFVSAAKEGEPKHPAKKVINAFRRRGAPVFATQGMHIWHTNNAPPRRGYPLTPLPFYHEVEE